MKAEVEMPESAPRSPRLPLVPFLEVLGRSRGFIVTLTIGTMIVAGAFAFIAPVTYEADLTILPPESASPLGAMGGVNLESSLSMLQFGLNTLRSADLYADMLRSRSVYRYAIDECRLLEAYHLTKMDTMRAYANAFANLRDDVTVETANNGLITVTTRAHTGFFASKADKQAAAIRAAELANTLARGLDEVNRTKNTSQARQARIYLESQLAATSAHLDQSGKELADFQRRHLAVDLSEQVKVGIETAGRLEADVMLREVTLGVALQSMQPTNPEVRRLQTELFEMRRQLRNLQRGASFLGGDSAAVGLESLPDLSRRFALLLREVKVQETLYEMLTAQLYQTRVKETEQLPVVQVLDEARTPVWKSSPIVRKVALLAGLLGLGLSVFLALAREWWSRYPWGREDVRVLRQIFRR